MIAARAALLSCHIICTIAVGFEYSYTDTNTSVDTDVDADTVLSP